MALGVASTTTSGSSTGPVHGLAVDDRGDLAADAELEAPGGRDRREHHVERAARASRGELVVAVGRRRASGAPQSASSRMIGFSSRPYGVSS